MQLLSPLFPDKPKMISSCLGVYEKEGIVRYIANGLPIYSHTSEDLQSFRFITSNLINQGLCQATEVARCFRCERTKVVKSLKAQNRHRYKSALPIDR